MKAKSPIDGEWYYFVDKCLPFESLISCAHFQDFSDAIAFIMKKKMLQDLVNYLDDFLFVDLMKAICNQDLHTFIALCCEINFPVNKDKTFWATTCLVFLGMLIDTVHQTVSVPQEKIKKAQTIIDRMLSKKNSPRRG